MIKSIKKKFRSAFIGMAVGPLILTGIFIGWISFKTQLEQEKHYQKEVSESASFRIDYFLSGSVMNQIKIGIYFQDLEHLSRSQQKEYLSHLLTYKDPLYKHAFHSVALFDFQQGLLSCEALYEDCSVVNFKDRYVPDELISQVRDGKEYYGPALFDEITSEPYLSVAVPLVNINSGQVWGALIGNVRLKAIWDIIGEIQFGKRSSVYLVGQKGKVIAHADPSVVLKGTRFKTPKKDGLHVGLSGDRVVMATRAIILGKRTFHLVSERPLNEVISPIIQILWMIGGVIFIALVMSLLFGFLVERQVVKPIEVLGNKALQIGAGSFNQRVEMNRNDELGQLAEAFNLMGEQLKSSFDRLSLENVERKRAESKMRDSEENFRLISETSLDTIYRLDREGNIVFINDAGAQMYGYALEEITNMAFSVLMSKKQLPEGQRIVEQVLSGQSVKGELYVKHKKGHEFPISFSMAPIMKKDKLVGFAGVSRDISQEKRTIRALRESEEKFSTIFRLSPVGKVITSLADGKCIDVNENFTHITGYAADESKGRTSIELGFWINPPDRDRATQILKKQGMFHELEFRFQNRKGEIRLGSFSSAVVKVKGEPCIITTLNDITEQEQMKEELKQHREYLEEMVQERTKELVGAQEQLTLLVDEIRTAKKALEYKAAELESFTYSVSHDLKAPLRGMDGYSRLLEEDHADRLNDEGRSFLKTIRRSAEQMNRLIDDLLRFSRIDQGEIDCHEVDVAGMIENILKEKQEDLACFKIDVNPDLQSVVAEPEGLLHALGNLLENAVKFSRNEPAPKIIISTHATKEEWIFQIEDNGIGFDMKYHDRIFKIFQRLERSEAFPGTGVGLAIVKKVTERINGRVWAESEKGNGATFYLALPVKK